MLSAVMVSVALAESKGNTTNTEAITIRVNATSTAVRNDNATGTNAKNDNATSTNGQLTAQEHRSAVASFVKSLLDVADREGGIGPQVRVVAQAQNDSASTTEAAIAKVESRSPLTTILFGSDYKSLGQLRSEMVTTQNNVDQLNKLMAKATNDADKTELATQIKALEDSQAKVSAFVDLHENSFSLFGWFTKWFSN